MIIIIIFDEWFNWVIWHFFVAPGSSLAFRHYGVTGTTINISIDISVSMYYTKKDLSFLGPWFSATVDPLPSGPLAVNTTAGDVTVWFLWWEKNLWCVCVGPQLESAGFKNIPPQRYDASEWVATQPCFRKMHISNQSIWWFKCFSWVFFGIFISGQYIWWLLLIVPKCCKAHMTEIKWASRFQTLPPRGGGIWIHGASPHASPYSLIMHVTKQQQQQQQQQHWSIFAWNGLVWASEARCCRSFWATLMVWCACRLDATVAYSSSADPKCWLQSVRKREQSVGDAALNNGNSFSGFSANSMSQRKWSIAA